MQLGDSFRPISRLNLRSGATLLALLAAFWALLSLYFYVSTH